MTGTVAPLQASYQKRYAGDLAPGSLERMRDFRPEIVRRAIGVLPASGKPTPRTSIDRLVNRMPKACLCRAARSNLAAGIGAMRVDLVSRELHV
jgi:hypothetical protein